MFFFKSKPKPDEIAPPPQPTQASEFKNGKEGPKFFDEIVKPKKFKAEISPEMKEFSELVKKLDGHSSQKKAPSLKEKIGENEREQTQKEERVSKKRAKQQKKAQVKQKKMAISPSKVKAIERKGSRKPKVEADDLEYLELPEFELPKELKKPSKKDIELPEMLEAFDIGGFGNGPKEETKEKSKEILEAEEEINGAIEKIKELEKPSFFKRLFSKFSKQKDFAIAEKQEVLAEPQSKQQATGAYSKKPIDRKPTTKSLTQKSAEVDDVFIIQDNIEIAKEALIKFDFDKAKKIYMDIMKLYKNIKPEDQTKVYPDIRELYFQRKNAEELKVK